MSWSSGKDSAFALHALREAGDAQVVALVTTVNRAFERVAMHAVRQALLERQAEAAGLPLWTVQIPNPCSNAQYEDAWAALVSRARAEGIEAIAFGDLYLEDIRAYRLGLLEGTGIEARFPLWVGAGGTAALARKMLDSGIRAHITCLDPRVMPRALAGSVFDDRFLDALPRTVDPLGENGEFHTFCFAGPMFSAPIEVTVGETLERDGFVFTDLTPAPGSSPRATS